MRYFSSFQTSLKISRYLFRIVGVMLWGLGALVTVFYLLNIYNGMRNDIRQQYYSDYDALLAYFRQSTDMTRDIRYMNERFVENKEVRPGEPADRTTDGFFIDYRALNTKGDCAAFRTGSGPYIIAFKDLLTYWQNNIAAPMGLNQVFLVGSKTLCMVSFPIRNLSTSSETLRRMVNDYSQNYFRLKSQGKERTIYWAAPGSNQGMASLFVMMPLYYDGRFLALMGIERNLQLENFNRLRDFPANMVIINEQDDVVLSYPEEINTQKNKDRYLVDDNYFGYDDEFTQLVFKRRLTPSLLSVVYTTPLSSIYEKLKFQILNGAILNLISAIIIGLFTWLLERRIFMPAENSAMRLEEHEQFNHKIVASAPVGICILCTLDGTALLSNELAHNYWRMLSFEDRNRIGLLIKDKRQGMEDMVTRNGGHLQVSFVHSRYQNEEVAICVLVDISARVQLESSLQDAAQAAEQANQSKSMFLATVSHELRTPLYGIIGNLELLQSMAHSRDAQRLLGTMNNSSSLLLKIISDILDFSKIESKQLKIEPREFNFREHIHFVVANYLPLVAKKHLSLYCFIEKDVPELVCNDPVRMQQVIANLFNNAIKYTHVGMVCIHVYVCGEYLHVDIQDTGGGISEDELRQLFDPFYQIMPNTDSPSQGTGLGLPICEKLISLMDGDMMVESQKEVGSLFGIRFPCYTAYPSGHHADIAPLTVPLVFEFRNGVLADYMQRYWQDIAPAAVPLSECPDIACAVVITDVVTPAMKQARLLIELDAGYTDKPVPMGGNHWRHNTHQLDGLFDFVSDRLNNRCQEADDLPPPPLPDSQQAAHVRILIVDDHPINRHLLSDQLHLFGFHTATADDGLDALDFLETHEVDIILSDVNMPNMNGYDLTRTLREKGMTLPVIGITANALAEERERCLASGMNDCLSKPVSMQALRTMMQHYIPQVTPPGAE
ncbi:two-component system sensor histidine kinase RcsC [Morganella morganii]|nr:two-component system sensor histidine kinase RcsC [Morganella morganii]